MTDEIGTEEQVRRLLNEREQLYAQVTRLQRELTHAVERERLHRGGGGILSGPAIKSAVERGDIRINPYNEKHLNPASVDLTLGPRVMRYALRYSKDDPTFVDSVLYTKKANPTTEEAIPDDGFLLVPGALYLMHTQERVSTHRYVPVLDGKSSIGRLGVQVHLTAGYGDPGFDGQYTLEVITARPVKVYAGMRFCQMRFHTIAGEVQLYRGNYQDGQFGPTASRSWAQFEDAEKDA